MTPYISITDELPAEAFLEAIEDARTGCTPRSWSRAALDLRHSGRLRTAGGRADGLGRS